MNIISRKISHEAKHVLMFSIILICLFSLFAPAVSRAATPATPPSYTLLEPLPCLKSDAVSEIKDANGNIIQHAQPAVTCSEGPLKKTITFEEYVNYIFTLFIALSAVAAVFMIVWGGFKYTTTDSYSGKSEGKQVIFNALQGLLLVLCSYLILRTIDPRLVAIPKTLVDPLQIPCPTNKPNEHLLTSDPGCASFNENYFSALETEFAKYKVDVQGTIDSVKKIEVDVNLLKTQKADLQNTLENTSGLNDTQKEALKAQIASLDSTITGKTDSATLITTDAMMKSVVRANSQPLSRLDPDTYKASIDSAQKEIADIQKKYASGISQPDSAQTLKDQANYSNAVLEIEKLVDGVYIAATHGDLTINSIKTGAQDKIDAVYQKYIDYELETGIKDVALTKQLNQFRSKAKVDISSFK